MHWQHILDGLTNMEPVGKKMMQNAELIWKVGSFDSEHKMSLTTQMPILNWLNDEVLIEPRGNFESLRFYSLVFWGLF